jgi:Protein of unknown function (DUF1565)
MRGIWVSRLFFAVVAVLAIAGIASGTACTRWGQPGPITPTLAPISQLYVDPHTGSDSSGNGSQTKPYKTLTKAVAVVTAAKSLSPNGVTIFLSNGEYVARNGEVFPIVLPRDVTITGTNYGRGPHSGTFIDGIGEDTLFESIVHAPAKTAYTTFEVAPTVNVNLSDLYVGASSIRLPGSKAGYVSVDVLGTLNVSDSGLGAGIATALRAVSGVLVAGGSFTCTSCQIRGNDFAVGGISVTVPTASPYATPPSITLGHGTTDSTVAAKVVDIATDGSVDVTASAQTFARSRYAFADVLDPVITTSTRGAIDFGGGAANSNGGNDFIGALTTEIYLKRRYETVTALDDTWNPRQQKANRNGQYVRKLTFGSGTSGKNVTILKDATGSTVTVGPAIVPTSTPSGSPGPTPTPTPT